MTEFVTTDRITAGETQTSEVYTIQGQKSRWRYPDVRGRLTPNDAEKIRNMNLTERGTALTAWGKSLYNSTQLTGAEAVVGLNETTYPSYGAVRLVVTPTKIYTDDGTTRQDITGAVSWSGGNDDRVRFAYLDRKIFLNNGVDQVVTWSGDDSSPASCAALTGMPWTKVRDIVPHRGVLVALRPTESGADELTRVRWSDVDRRTYESDTSTWYDANRTEIYEGGAPIIGGLDNWGRLWVFKGDGAYSGRVVLKTGRFEYEFLDEVKGFEAISHLSLLARPEFIFGAAREGLFVIRRDGSFELVTTDIQSDWRALNQSRLPYVQSRVRERDHQVRTLVSSASNTAGHDLELIWDWETNAVWFDEPTDTMGYGARAVVSNEEIDFLGTTDGYVLTGNDEDEAQDHGTDVSWEVIMAPNDLGMPGKRKDIIALRTYLREKSGSQTINFACAIDQGRSGRVTSSITGGTTLQYDTGLTYDSGLVYGGGIIERPTVEINRKAETITPHWYGSDPVELIGYDVEWVPVE